MPARVAAVYFRFQVHVLTRIGIGAGEMSVTKLEVVSMRPHGDIWRMQFSGQMQGMAQMIRAQLLTASE